MRHEDQRLGLLGIGEMGASTAARVEQGAAEQVGVKFREARESGFALTITDLRYRLCGSGERVVSSQAEPCASVIPNVVRNPSLNVRILHVVQDDTANASGGKRITGADRLTARSYQHKQMSGGEL